VEPKKKKGHVSISGGDGDKVSCVHALSLMLNMVYFTGISFFFVHTFVHPFLSCVDVIF